MHEICVKSTERSNGGLFLFLFSFLMTEEQINQYRLPFSAVISGK